MKNNFRHEYKYLISDAQAALLKQRAKGLMSLDPHVGEDGFYRIRSLYFDDFENRCFYENENGTDPREKFRIRIYQSDASRILLECKRKERGKTQKNACLLTEEQTRLLMAGKVLPDVGSQPPLLQKLTLQMLTRRLRPAVIVEYDRIPFVYRDGNVRVTLDMHLSSSSAVDRFLEAEIPQRPVMEAGRQILEVKYDALLPDFIRSRLQLPSLVPTAWSKYYMCRKFK